MTSCSRLIHSIRHLDKQWKSAYHNYGTDISKNLFSFSEKITWADDSHEI